MPKAKPPDLWIGSFTPYDPKTAPVVVMPAEPEAPVPEAVPPVPNTYPAGQTYESFLYSLIQDMETSIESLGGGSMFTITNPNDGDILIYDGLSQTFINVVADDGPFLPKVGGTITGTPGTLTINSPVGETGSILNVTANGSRRFIVDADGDSILELTDTSNSGPTATLRISHRTSSGTPTTGMGSKLQFWADDDGHTLVEYATIQTEASSTNTGSVSADLVFLNKILGTSTEALRFKGSDGRAVFAGNVQAPAVHVGDLVTHPATLSVSRAGVAADPAVPTYLRVKAVADTGMTNAPTDIIFDLGAIRQLATGNIAAIRSINVTGPQWTAASATTVTQGATLFVNGAPIAGTNVTISDTYALYVNGTSRFDAGSSGGISYVWQLPADNTPVGASVGRIPVNIGGSLKYIPYHNA